MTETFTIPSNRLEAFYLTVKKLNKKATKYGFDTFEPVVGEPYLTKGDGSNMYEAVDVDFEDVVHGFEGYRIIGVTENIKGIHTLNVLEEGFDLKEHRGTCVCDHCGANRKRNKVYFLADEDDKMTRLGSSCVTKFFTKGVSSALAKFKFIEEVNDFREELQDELGEYAVNSSTPAYKLHDILYQTALMAHTHGFVSTSAKSYDHYATSTKERVLINLGQIKSVRFVGDVTAVEYATKTAPLLAEYAKTKIGVNDYFDTIQEIITAGYVPYRLVGYIVGIYSWWTRELNKAIMAEASEGGESKFIGELGNRMDFTGIVKRVYFYDGNYGRACITTLNCDGDIAVYFGQFKVRGKDDYAVVGDTVHFSAEVKKQEEYNGINQTTIGRPTKVSIDHKEEEVA